MTQISGQEEERSFSEESESLWRIAFAPALWALHFALSYASTAIFCAKAPTESLFPFFRIGIAALTLVALGLIAWTGWRAWRQWDYLDDYDYEHASAVAEDRHEFLGHAAFLLAIISFVGVIYVGLPVAFIESCR